MPVEVDWSRNDTDLLGRFWDQHQGQQEASAEISDRILVFHRGIDTVRPPHPTRLTQARMRAARGTCPATLRASRV